MSKSAARPPHQPAAVPAPLAGAPPSHQSGRAAAGLSCRFCGRDFIFGLDGDKVVAWHHGPCLDWQREVLQGEGVMKTTLNLGGEALVACQDQLVETRLSLRSAEAVLAEAQARAEHWAAQADRLAGQIEAMRVVMLEVAEKLEWISADDDAVEDALAERLRRAAGGEGE